MKGHLAVVKALLKAGSPIDWQNHKGETSLHYATKHLQIRVVAHLVKQHAEMHIRSKAQSTPLDWVDQQLSIDRYGSTHKSLESLKAILTGEGDLEQFETNQEQEVGETVEQLKDEVQLLKKENEKMKQIALEDRLCVICFEEQKNAIFVPCGHVATCMSCAKQMIYCPICRGNVNMVVQVFDV